MSKPSIGFVGLGELGSAIAEKLVSCGFTLTVCDLEKSKVDAACKKGALAGGSPAELANNCDVLITCVTDTKAVTDVVFGEGGFSETGRGDQLFIDNSTIDPEVAKNSATKLREQTGMRWVDAPVTGGATGALNSKLVIMAGGSEQDVNDAREIVKHYSQRVTHMGPNGAGQATKLANQMIIGSTLAAVAEALNFGANFGIDAKSLPDCLAGGWADSAILQDHARRMAAATYSGSAKVMLKDMDLCCEMGRRTESPMPVTALTAELYRKLVSEGHDDKGQIGLMWLYKQEAL